VEFEPPLACVRRILKKTLPSSTNVGKDASAAFARASGIFIIYITACANDYARENRRQTITANDVLAAIKVRVFVFLMLYDAYSCCICCYLCLFLLVLTYEHFVIVPLKRTEFQLLSPNAIYH
jgi:histone H3/H4